MVTKQQIQCSSDISEPKYTHNARQPNTRIRVCIYAHTRMHIPTYAYTVYTRMPHWHVWANVLFFSFLTGHCYFQWLASLPQSEKEFSMFWQASDLSRHRLKRTNLPWKKLNNETWSGGAQKLWETILMSKKDHFTTWTKDLCQTKLEVSFFRQVSSEHFK